MKDNTQSEITEEKEDYENNKINIESMANTRETKYDSSFQPAVEIHYYENEKNYHDEEENDYENDEQNLQLNIETSVRNGFIRKVYGILSIQLIITFSFVLLFQLPSIKKLILSNIQLTGNLLTFSSISFLVLFLILVCFRNLSKAVPYNYIFLLLY